MGREVRRVALDFEWPLKECWHGFVNPHHTSLRDCLSCKRSGYNKIGRFLSDSWYHFRAREMFGAFFGDNILSVRSYAQLKREGQPDELCDNIEMARRFGFKILAHWSDKLEQEEVDALVAKDYLRELTHAYSEEDGWQLKKNASPLTPDDVARYAGSFSYGSSQRYVCVQVRAKRFGVNDLFCEECGGEGEYWASEEAKVAAEEWKPTNPPAGDGWQMWETTSEGSPMSPVFATPEELARWLADTGANTFGYMTANYDTWLKMIKGSGWAPSGMMSPETGVISGVEAVARKD